MNSSVRKHACQVPLESDQKGEVCQISAALEAISVAGTRCQSLRSHGLHLPNHSTSSIDSLHRAFF